METHVQYSFNAFLTVVLFSILLTGCYPSDVIKAVDDPNFQKSLLKYDVNGDGKLTKQEALFITGIAISPKQNTKGIKYLENLERLTIDSEEATELDLSNNHKLKEIVIKMNNLKKLKVNKEVENLQIWNSGDLKELSLSSLPNLKQLDITGNINKLTLKALSLENLPQLETLEINNTLLTTIALNNVPSLISLNLNDNTELTSVKTGKESHLEKLYFYNCPNFPFNSICQQSDLKQLTIQVFHRDREAKKNFGRLELGKQPNLESLSIQNHDVDLSKMQAPNLTNIELLYAISTDFGDLSRFPSLKVIELPWNYRTTLDVSKNPHIDYVKGMEQLQEIKVKRGQVNRLISHYQGAWRFNFQYTD